MTKKILFFMPSFEGGGVEKNIIMIINYFIKKNVDIGLITTSKEISKIINRKVDLIVPKYNFWNYQSRFIKYTLCIFFLFFEYCKNKNFNVFCFQGNLICVIFCKIFKLKIIIRPNSSPAGWSNNFFKKFLFSKILKLADIIVVNSLLFKKEFKDTFELDTKCIYNPLNSHEIIRLSRKKINFKFFRKDSLNLISLGRLVKQKDHITAIKAVKILKNKLKLRLLIIGDGIEKNNLNNYIKKNKLNDIIRIKNRLKNPFPYLLNAKIMLLTSKYEGLPNVLLEALALNKFIISADCPTGPKEILNNGKGGLLFKVGDYYELSKKIIFYNKNKKKMYEKKKFAIRKLGRFDYQKNLNRYFNLFKYL